MYNVVIFGAGNATKTVISGLRENVKIICYLDNDPKKWNVKFEEKMIHEPEYITKIEYDFVVIVSQEDYLIYQQLIEMGIPSEKIFRYINFFMFANNILKNKLKLYKIDKKEYDVLTTGLSYFVSGINSNVLYKSCINLAYDSHDLYYDYNIAKYLIEEKNKKFLYCIIGISYYSFQYDLSLSNMKNNVNMYYDTLKVSHNFHIDMNKFMINKEKVEQEKEIAKKILKLAHKNIDGIDIYGNYYKENDSIQFFANENKAYIGLIQAKKDCNKNYPNTVSENIKIIKEYLYLLKSHNIKPIIVVCPTSKYYYNNFSDVIKKEFFSIINNLRKEFTFQFIDYFDSTEFDDADFRDVSHLNTSGGEKFTQILNREIQW